MKRTAYQDRFGKATVANQRLFHQYPFFPEGDDSQLLRYEYRHELLRIPSLSSQQAKTFMTRLLSLYPALDENELARICQVGRRTVQDWRAGSLRLKGETIALIYRHIHRVIHPCGTLSEDEFLLERAQWIQEVLAA